MSTLTLAMALPNSLKRSYDEAGLAKSLDTCSTPPNQAPVASDNNQQIFNPPDSFKVTGQQTKEHLILDATTNTKVPGDPPSSSLPETVAQPCIKKAKLSYEEREVKRIEKEVKARERAEEKARREEEKTKKELEKAEREKVKTAKEVERREKKKARETQAEHKKEEKRRKDQAKEEQEKEKIKKSRNQLRLNAFFTVPSMPDGTSSTSPTRNSHSPLSSRRSSISEIQAIEASRRSRSISCTPKKVKPSDYERTFLSFCLPQMTSLAPHNRFCCDKEDLSQIRDTLDESLIPKMDPEAATANKTRPSIFELLPLSPYKILKRFPQVGTVKEILEEVEGTTSHPIDLVTFDNDKKTPRNPLEQLRSVPMKVLKFAEDVRPPYVGTYTKLPRSIPHLARNPIDRGLPNTNYDYDSEAEWEDLPEGEDLDSEGEEEAEDDEDDEDMAGFLDDEGATDAARTSKRRPLLGNQEPVCSGICWEGPQGQILSQECVAVDWRLLKLDILMENSPLTIDPYCTTYWTSKVSTNAPQSMVIAQNNLMEPPRLPLHPINWQNNLAPSSSPAKPSIESTSNSLGQIKPAKPHRQIPPELMEEFKAAIQGNDLTKVGLLEVLKNKFPKQSKDAIKDTLEAVAERVGPKPTEKKWVLKDGS